MGSCGRGIKSYYNEIEESREKNRANRTEET